MNKFQISLKVAFTFFIIGTILLCLHIFFKDEEHIIIFGYIYVMLAVFINSIILIVLIISLIIHKDREESLKAIGIILANVPVATGYFFIVINTL